MTSVFAVLFACAALSCAPDSRTDSPFGPETTPAGQTSVQAQVDTAVRTPTGPIDASKLVLQGYTVIEEPAPKPVRTLLGWVVETVDATVAKLLGTEGGVLSILGHVVNVPAGAVSEPTIFSMTVIQNGYVEVELTAVPQSFLRRLMFWLPPPEVKFAVPVDLSLTYARATNVTDPSRLKILRINPDGRHEIMPSTVDTVKKTVTAKLDHFSRYCMIAN